MVFKIMGHEGKCDSVSLWVLTVSDNYHLSLERERGEREEAKEKRREGEREGRERGGERGAEKENTWSHAFPPDSTAAYWKT